MRNVLASESTPGGNGVLQSPRGYGEPPGGGHPRAITTEVIAIHFAAERGGADRVIIEPP